MFKKWAFLWIVLFLANAASALDYAWYNFSGTPGNYNDPANWVLKGGVSNGLVPGPGDIVYTRGAPEDWALVDPTVQTIDSPAPSSREWGYDMGTTGSLMVRTAESWYNWTPQTININAADNITISGFRGGNAGHLTNSYVNIYGTLTSTGSTFDLERNNYGSVEFNQYTGSTVNINGSNGLRMGYKSYRAAYNIYGGVLNVSKLTIPDGSSGFAMSNNIGAYPTANLDRCYTMAQAVMNLYGGSVYVGAGGLNINNLSSPIGKLNITEGTLYLLGDATAMVQLFTLLGGLVAYDGAGTIQYAFDGTNTIVTAIPEPATLLLLTLGAVTALRRRRK
jgi:hypothetical protein